MGTDRPWMSSDPSGYGTHSERYPLDLFSFTREAAFCRNERRFLAVIAMSATAVELVVNRDSRTRSHPDLKRIAGWANLNNFNLRVAKAQGLPVGMLLEAGDDLRPNKSIADCFKLREAASGPAS
jgi:hypothetical protein